MALINVFTLIFSLLFGAHPSPTTPASVPVPVVTESPATSQAETLAKCLTKKGVIMYGAYWCPHCQKQKALFGDAFQYVKYQECDSNGNNGNPKICEAAGIKGYPTWQIPGSGKIEGEQTFEELAKAADCQL
jgi:thiol-disulfide isomerase/thioredoxin